MEGKHFSHPHKLSPHQAPECAKISCSGCDSPCWGPVMACWQCKFFLHEQCFKASSILDHPDHSSHPLVLLPYPTHPSARFLCSFCKKTGTGLSFSCPKCDFHLHVHCAYKPETPNIEDSDPSKNCQIKHRSHPAHPLTLLSPPPYEFTCDACGDSGGDSVFHCYLCNFDLHSQCAALPDIVRSGEHKHPLTLHSSVRYKNDGVVFLCDVCGCHVSKNLWIYLCGDCNYGAHVNCVGGELRRTWQRLSVD
ncbi:hypothetical protein NMG60_11023309 [Bertholletia excelsa]